MAKCISDDWSLKDKEGICAFSWFNSSPNTIWSPNYGSCVPRGITDDGPKSFWVLEQLNTNLCCLVVIAGALVSGFKGVDDEVDELKVALDSVSLFAGSDGDIIWADWGGKEFEEHVGPAWVDYIDFRSGGKEYLLGWPKWIAGPDLFGLDEHEEINSVISVKLIHFLFDVLCIGGNVVLEEAAGSVGEISQGGDHGLGDSRGSEIIEAEVVAGGGSN